MLPFSNEARSELGELCRQIDDLNQTIQKLRASLKDEEKRAFPWWNHHCTTSECVINSIGLPLVLGGTSSVIVSLFLQSYSAIFTNLFAGGMGIVGASVLPMCLTHYDFRKKSEGFAQRFHKLYNIEGNLYKSIKLINALAFFNLILEEWKKNPTDEKVQFLFKSEEKMVEILKNWNKSSLQEDLCRPRSEAPQEFIDEMKGELPHEAYKLALMDELSIVLPSAKFAQEWHALMDTSCRSFKWINVNCQPWKDLEIANPEKSVYEAYFTHHERANSVLLISQQIANFVAKQEVAPCLQFEDMC